MAPKKKIIHIIQSLNNGGWENAMLRLLPLLTDDFEHHIITLRELGELAPQFKKKGIPVTTVNWGGFFDFTGYQKLFLEAKRLAPNIVVTYLFHADMIGRLFLQKKISAPIIPFLGTTYNYPRYWPARVLERLIKKYTRHYLANSPAVSNFYIKEIGVPKEKITTISTGINIEYFDNLTVNPELRKLLGITPADFVIICVANLHPNKGHRYLLEAFESLSSQHPDLKLLIVGDGMERENLKQQIANYWSKKNILFLGRRTDVPQLLKISNLFILPTLFEGMSNAIMEAMASGLPVITTNIPENRVLIENNISGLLVPIKSSKKITQTIQTLLDSKKYRERLGTAGKTYLKENFGLEKSACDFSRFLSSL